MGRGEKYGIKYSLPLWMLRLIETFASFEKEHPTTSTLQAFRYQIAQAYWEKKDWTNTRKWLQLVIEKSGEADSF
jgi:hypothetical protein